MPEEDPQQRTAARGTRLFWFLIAAIHRAERSERPESLGALTPDSLPEPPADLFTGASYRYRRAEDGVLID